LNDKVNHFETNNKNTEELYRGINESQRAAIVKFTWQTIK